MNQLHVVLFFFSLTPDAELELEDKYKKTMDEIEALKDHLGMVKKHENHNSVNGPTNALLFSTPNEIPYLLSGEKDERDSLLWLMLTEKLKKNSFCLSGEKADCQACSVSYCGLQRKDAECRGGTGYPEGRSEDGQCRYVKMKFYNCINFQSTSLYYPENLAAWIFKPQPNFTNTA